MGILVVSLTFIPLARLYGNKSIDYCSDAKGKEMWCPRNEPDVEDEDADEEDSD